MHVAETISIPDDEFGNDLDFANEEYLDGKDEDNMPGPVLSPNHFDSLQGTLRPFYSPVFAENHPLSSTSLAPVPACEMCSQAAYRNGPGGIYPTCGNKCASKLQALSGLPNQKQARTSGPPNSDLMSSNSETRTTGITRFHSRPNQINMCNVCHVRPRCQRGGRIYPTCGLSCAAKLHVPGSVEMCDYCKKKPKVIINQKTYPQCGKTCRDKANLAKAAANSAACRSCILCWRSTKRGESDFCSSACHSLADVRAPFLIEIPRGHVSFKTVAEFFTSEWQASNWHCPTIKRVYMVSMKSSFRMNFDKYRSMIGSQIFGVFQKKAELSKRWLFVSRECGFGNPGDLEPCHSNKSGIRTSGLNRAVEHYRSSKKTSSKIAALTDVVVGREAKMTLRRVQLEGVHLIPPQDTDSVRIIEEHIDGLKVDTGDIIVYNGDAVKPLYLISYE